MDIQLKKEKKVKFEPYLQKLSSRKVELIGRKTNAEYSKETTLLKSPQDAFWPWRRCSIFGISGALDDSGGQVQTNFQNNPDNLRSSSGIIRIERITKPYKNNEVLLQKLLKIRRTLALGAAHAADLG